MESDARSLGIVAGAGRFPFLVARGARDRGIRVVIVGLRGLAHPDLRHEADIFRWAGMARLGGWIRRFRRHAIKNAVMAGSVRKSDMYSRYRLLAYIPDWTSFRLWFFQLKDKRNDTVLCGVADELARHGIQLENCVQYCPEALAPQGLLTRTGLSAAQQKDLEFGWTIAKELGRLDIGQSIAVKETEVIAVEAIEGTDRMIERAGQLCPRGGWMLIKVAKPHQDMRFDVPTAGPDTIERLHRHGARALVIEAGKTILIDRESTCARADNWGISIVGHQAD